MIGFALNSFDVGILGKDDDIIDAIVVVVGSSHDDENDHTDHKGCVVLP